MIDSAQRKYTTNKNSVDEQDDIVEAGLFPLVSSGHYSQDTTTHGRENHMVPLGRVVILCIGAMLIGALLPTIFANRRDVVPITGQVDNDSTKTSRGQDLDRGDIDNPVRHSDDNTPAIAWCMSFPNSGTSYTMNLVMAASNMSQATNYGRESLTQCNKPLVPVFDQGPFWLDPEERRPTELVLTKTHCGGFCHDCRPDRSMETPHSFLMHCSQSNEIKCTGTDISGATERNVRTYDSKNRVDRAVHLIRDPFDNMVSRYHLDLNTLNNTGRLHEKRYTYDRDGFSAFCQDQDPTFAHMERSDKRVDQEALALIQDIPCHWDLFRYVQWHNLAFVTTQDLLNIPTLVMHYEEYTTSFEATLGRLLDFLKLPNTGNFVEFQSGKSYRNYFTKDQISRIKNATMLLASPMTWKHLERYF